MTLRDELQSIFDAERALRDAEARLFADEDAHQARVRLLGGAVQEAKSLEDRNEARLRLERLADLCAQVPGPEMVDALIAILDDADERVRVQAAEALSDVGWARYAEVARGIDRALADGSRVTALKELPWVIEEIGEPSAVKLLSAFLKHADAEVVAAGLEALASLGEPVPAKHLKPLLGDTRAVTVEDEEEGTTITLGELAEEALETLAPR